jgi:hypothetical protein
MPTLARELREVGFATALVVGAGVRPTAMYVSRIANPTYFVYNTTKLTKAVMGTSKLIHAGSEPGYGESRVSQMGRKSSRSRDLNVENRDQLFEISRRAGVVLRYPNGSISQLAVLC